MISSVQPSDRGPVYRSNTPVSARVDVAWYRGYEAGKKEERERNLILVGAALALVWLRRYHKAHLHLLPWIVALSLVLTMTVGPVLVFVVIARSAMRIYVRRMQVGQPVGGQSVAATESASEGSPIWPPF